MGDDEGNPGFVTAADCARMQGEVLNEIRRFNGDIRKIKNSLYGIEEAGELRGGLVNMFSDFIRDQKRSQSGLKWLIERIITPIVIPITVALMLLRLGLVLS